MSLLGRTLGSWPLIQGGAKNRERGETGRRAEANWGEGQPEGGACDGTSGRKGRWGKRAGLATGKGDVEPTTFIFSLDTKGSRRRLKKPEAARLWSGAQAPICLCPSLSGLPFKKGNKSALLRINFFLKDVKLEIYLVESFIFSNSSLILPTPGAYQWVVELITLSLRFKILTTLRQFLYVPAGTVTSSLILSTVPSHPLSSFHFVPTLIGYLIK
jgi:hypothetical protein